MSAYVKTFWVDDDDPDITADNLNKMEQGIFDAHSEIQQLSDRVDGIGSGGGGDIDLLNAHIADRNNPHVVTNRHIGSRHHLNVYKEGAKGDGAADDTSVIQRCLDRLRDSGGGEIYFPRNVFGLKGAVYKTKGLWVPSNVRIVSDEATLKCIGKGPVRCSSIDGDLIPGHAMLMLLRQKALGYTDDIAGVTIEGLRLDGNGQKDMTGIYTAANDVHVRYVRITGGLYDGAYIGRRGSLDEGRSSPNYFSDIRLNEVFIDGSQRNNVSVVHGYRIWIEDGVFTNCTGVVTNPDTTPELAPGCGIEVEPIGTSVWDIWMARNRIKGNAGAGVAFVLDAVNDHSAESYFLLDNLITDNATKVQVFTAGDAGVGSTGGVYLYGGQTNGGAIHIRGNNIRSNKHGYGVNTQKGALGDGNPIGAKLFVQHNDLRGNASGPKALPDAPSGSVVGNNIES